MYSQPNIFSPPSILATVHMKEYRVLIEYISLCRFEKKQLFEKFKITFKDFLIDYTL